MFEKRLNNKLKIDSKIDLQFSSNRLCGDHLAAKIIRFCFFKAYTKAYVNKVFIWESFLSVLYLYFN